MLQWLSKYTKFEIYIGIALFSVFLFSFSYKFGGYFYTLVPWVFLVGLFMVAFSSIVGIFMFPLALVYQTLFYYKLNFLPGSLGSLYLVLIVGTLLYRVFVMQKEKIKLDTNTNLIIGLFSVFIVSTVINGYTVGFRNYQLVHYFEAILVFFVITIFVTSKHRLRMFSWILLIGIAGLAFRLFNHAFNYDRAIPGFENNYLARVLAFYAPFFLGLFWAEAKKAFKFVALSISALTVQSITQLGSRATYISLGIAGAMMGLYNIKRRSMWGISALGIIFLVFFTPSLFLADLYSIPIGESNLEEIEEGSISGRAWVLARGWEAFKERPLIGYGVYTGRFETLMQERYQLKKSAHNSYVQIAVEAGMFALIFYVGLIIVSCINCYRAMILTKNKDKFLYNVSQGTLFGIIAISLNQFMLNNPWIATLFIGFGVSSAILFIAKDLTTENLPEGK